MAQLDGRSQSHRRLETASFSVVHVDERYAFDGSHSDFAQQFYRRYLAGDTTASAPDMPPPDDVATFVSDFGLKFTSLPTLLQLAVIWDSGYVAAAALGFIKVRTRCGLGMADLAVSLATYQSAGCVEQTCAAPNGDVFHQSLYCNGFQMGNLSLCAASAGVSPVYAPMWSDGGADDVVPTAEIARHDWKDGAQSFTIFAIHLTGDPNAYGKCALPSMTIPCAPFDGSEVWCEPQRGQLVSQWLELEAQRQAQQALQYTDSQGRSEAWRRPVIAAAIVAGALLVVGGAVLWWRHRQQRPRSKTIPPLTPIQRRRGTAPILGESRGNGNGDEELAPEDIDFILEIPAAARSLHSFDIREASHRPSITKCTPPLDVIASTPPKALSSSSSSISLGFSSSLSSSLPRSPLASYVASTSLHSGLSSSQLLASAATTAATQSGSDPRRSDRLPPTPLSANSAISKLQIDVRVQAKRVESTKLSLQRRLAAGAFGEVWVGRLRGEAVAIKRLLPSQRRQAYSRLSQENADPDAGTAVRALEAFAAEIRLIARFNHPNVLALRAVAWTSLDQLSLVTDLITPGDLRRLLEHKGCRLEWRSAKSRVARDIARGLAYLHSPATRVVHRDLKSHNVLVSDDFTAKLCDFGMARRLRSKSDALSMTHSVGTAFWTAPEVFANERYTTAADIYAFGVVLAELDSGELPFADARTPDGKEKLPQLQVLSLVANGKLRPRFTASCPKPVHSLAIACLNQEPSARPTAATCAAALNDFLEATQEPDAEI